MAIVLKSLYACRNQFWVNKTAMHDVNMIIDNKMSFLSGLIIKTQIEKTKVHAITK
jgi:hypothetical protein